MTEGTEQKFGGPWSLIKTAMVAKYLAFYTTALKNQPFELVYIDAFAGSGAFRYVEDAGRQIELLPRDKSQDIHEGSAAIALSTDPPFHRIVFIEKKPDNVGRWKI